MNLKNAIRVRQNFEDRTLLETLRQERCARREAWDSTNNVFKLKGQGHVPLAYVGNVGTLVEKARGARIRGSFRSIDAHAAKEGFELS